MHVVMIAAVLCVTVSACAKKVSVDTEQFRAPIVEYLKAHSYGMEIVDFTGVEETGSESARVSCKMKDAEGLYAIAVTWDFLAANDGSRWTIKKHIAK
jgi:hypothetical protein